ncbi:hypothetical protein ALI22I_04855 [Saccharothrix sp. ALI-22-I]|uniref:hypothetical protein n=1 Tax=Saccharothrix sp. ALI-22-I TaxID=1933778 RepID=UPI00097C0A3C|nr:hypothetical protein [Saccharothrix sp. ALI-22-I]ONI92275.1 hypothetical protein ALI22I_04855 [Saccharothrix sp. ALI-22-I]
MDLTWDEVDPRRHPFDSSSALAVISRLEPDGDRPTRPAGSVVSAPDLRWEGAEGGRWLGAMAEAITARFGRWAVGWQWTRVDGGPVVRGWCCSTHSLTTPAETLPRIADALCDWRAWLEDLAERFDRFPLGDLPDEEREGAWERATVHLVTHVVARVEAHDAWYDHCEQVLTWFLTRWGVPADRARTLVEEAIGGRFGSWVEPDGKLVQDVAEHLAVTIEIDRL